MLAKFGLKPAIPPILKVKLGSGTPGRTGRNGSGDSQPDTAGRFASTRMKVGTPESADPASCASSSVMVSNSASSPFPRGHPHRASRYPRAHVSIPLVADEDALGASDLPALNGCIDGVNVKLAKTGGIRGALAMIHTARAMGLKVMIGCMIESAIAATAAAHLSPLVDWADLDGPLLTARDPFAGVGYECGKLILPDAPGLGVREGARQ